MMWWSKLFDLQALGTERLQKNFDTLNLGLCIFHQNKKKFGKSLTSVSRSTMKKLNLLHYNSCNCG